MKPQLFVGAFAVVFAASLPLRSVSDEPIWRVGHGVTAPRPTNHPDPEYSEEARRAGLQGKCVLSLVVNSEGKPEDIQVSRSLGMGLDEKSIEAVRNWTFEPARKNGKPVAVRINIVITFRQGKGAMTPEVRAYLKRLQKEDEAFRRAMWTRVYRIEGVTPAPSCRSTQDQGEDDANKTLHLGLKTDPRQYRLESITFTNNRTITNQVALRALFPIKDGEPFDYRKVGYGLQELKKAYGSQGFVSFKASVEPEINESRGSIGLRIKCEEGRQFYVHHVNIAGLDENTFQKLRKTPYVMPGQLYNERLAYFWLEKNAHLLLPDASIQQRVNLDLNEGEGQLVMTYDFTRCAN
jgi:TonB family protein